MTQYNGFNVKLSNSQLNKLKSAMKNENYGILRLLANVIGNSENETIFSQKLLLTNRQVTALRKDFSNYLSTNIKLSKTKLSKMQSGGLFNFLIPLTKMALPFLKTSAKPLIKNVLAPLGLTAAMSAIDGSIQKKDTWFWS